MFNKAVPPDFNIKTKVTHFMLCQFYLQHKIKFSSLINSLMLFLPEENFLSFLKSIFVNQMTRVSVRHSNSAHNDCGFMLLSMFSRFKKF